ncbi:unnamed protein product [Rhizoctonia solani]|uniref:Protein kinase domain-containing protein n=1 Tax=Rhizoctonia solani TaxID=456999 RepID=A0A8H3BTB4_9AGAM|nr:unnamed protein product [Rhizoctonia solani]
MSGTTFEAEITLNVLVEGDDPRRNIFNITVPLQSRFNQVLKIIQKEYWGLHQISLYGLDLYRANLHPEQARHIQLTDEAILLCLESVASEWPSQSDADPRLVHIVVQPRSRQVTNTSRADTPPSAETEFSKYIEDFNKLQLGFAQRAPTGNSSSAAQPKNFRAQQKGPNFINNGRPADKEGPPIILFHPVFGRFLTQLRSTDPIDPQVYRHTVDHFIVSQDLYEHETKHPEARDEVTCTSLRDLLGDTLSKVTANGVQADGTITGWDATRIIIMEMKNEIGTGGSDPSIQAAQSYLRYWSNQLARRWLNWCCCPSILVAIAGPWMCILGGIYLDRPVIQPLTHFLWVGSNPAQPSQLGYIARVFHCLSSARGELEAFYRTSAPPALGYNPARPFPYLTHYMDAEGNCVRFVYRKGLCPANPEKLIFLAETTAAENPRYIVVKFVQNYNTIAHKLLAEQKLAPELLYDGTQYPNDQPGPEHIMIVMEFVQGVNLDEWLTHFRLSQSALSDIDTALKLLHDNNFVFGDLRPPNVMILQDSSGAATGRAMLVDFDWCGKHLEGRYPLRMNMTLGWHEQVEPGAIMEIKHDIHMFKQLTQK